MEEIKEDNHVQVIATIHKNDSFFDIVISIGEMEISCYRDGIEKSAEEISEEADLFKEAYDLACKKTDELWRK